MSECYNFCDLLQHGNPNKLAKNLRGSILKSECYGHAKDLCRSIPLKQLNSIDVIQHVVNAIHRRDALSVVADVYSDSNQLLSTRRNGSEQLKNSEILFEAQLVRFNAHDAGNIPESLVALMLLASANIEDN